MNAELKLIATTEGFDKVQAGLSNVQKGLANTAVASNKLDSSLGSLKSQSQRSGQTLQDFGRVAQDVAFGPAAIANNITPLFESFSRLRTEAGGTIPALKQLGNTLLSPTGLLFGLSALSAAMSIAQFGLGAWERLFNKSNHTLSETAKILKDVVDSTAKEAVGVSSLVAVLRNENETRERKLAAINQLKKENPEIFKNLKLEGDLVVGLNESYKNYIANLSNVIRVKLIQAQLEQVLTKLIKEQGTGLTAEEKAAQGLNNINKKRTEELRKLGDQGVRAADAFGDFTESFEKLKSDKIASLNHEVERLMKQLEFFSKNIEISIPAPKAAKIIKDEVDKLEKSVIKADHIFVDFKDKYPGGFASVLSGVNQGAPSGIQLPKMLVDFAEEINAFLETSAETIAGNFGEALAAAMSGSAGIRDFFSGIFAVIGEGLQRLGKIFIAAAIKIEAIKKFLVKHPALAIAGGIALVAIGAAMKRATSGNAFATGVRNFSGGTALVGERGPELVTLPRGSNVLPAAQTSSFMGGGYGGFIAETRISGQDLLLTLKRAGGAYNRTT